MTLTDYKLNISKILDEGQALSDKGDIKEAIKLYKMALVMSKKQDVNILSSLYIRLGNAYYKLEDRDKATFYYEEYLKINPAGQTSVFSRLAYAYYYLDSDKCIDYHNKALNLEISKYSSANKLFAMIKSAYYSQQDIKDNSEYEADQVRSHLYAGIKKYTHDDKKINPDRKLNIGYLSSDCKAHTMMNYMLPLWENHNKEEFNFFIFNGCEVCDSTTEQIKKVGFTMIDCTKKNDQELAQIIYDNKIDILIDLGGYTHMKIYSVFYKPAPIIMSYLGYLNTLGIKEVDYIITDRYTIPEDKACLYTEKPLYIDRGYQVFRNKNIPELEPSPYKTNGYVTFGSFNCTSKFNDMTFYMWSKILEGMPDSRLLIYRTKLTKNIVQNIKRRLDRFGVSYDRVIFSNKKYTPHYRAYSLADISLDPYPFSGMSIAIETALMGVPTITLAGEGMQSRGAGRINQVLGLEDLNASCGEEYIMNAINLANDKARLDDFRTNLKNMMEESPIRKNPEIFARDVESMYKKAWQDFINSP